MAGEDHSEFACIDRDLEFEALLITLKDSDKTIAGLIGGRFCKNNMSFWCYVSLCFGPFFPDIAFNRIADFSADIFTDFGPTNYCCSLKNKISSSQSWYKYCHCNPSPSPDPISEIRNSCISFLFLLLLLFFLLLFERGINFNCKA